MPCAFHSYFFRETLIVSCRYRWYSGIISKASSLRFLTYSSTRVLVIFLSLKIAINITYIISIYTFFFQITRFFSVSKISAPDSERYGEGGGGGRERRWRMETLKMSVRQCVLSRKPRTLKQCIIGTAIHLPSCEYPRA